jgi:CheY-like chemotaxis protein
MESPNVKLLARNVQMCTNEPRGPHGKRGHWGGQPKEMVTSVQGAENTRGQSVLVVDDQSEIRELARLVLQDAGYTVHCAEHGAAALEAVDREPPAVILLDMHMPVMDGWQFVREYRSAPVRHVPLIVMTATHDARRYASEVGADRFLAKPFELDDLLNTVAELTS